jgi:hypothetical protein
VAHNYQYKPDEMRFVELKKKIETVIKDIRENVGIANIHFIQDHPPGLLR